MDSFEENVEMLSSYTNKSNEEAVVPDVAPFKKRPWYSINIRMIPCKTAYFFLIAKELVLRMNIVLFCINIGLSKSQAGFIAGLRLISAFFGAPLWGFIADKNQNHRKVLYLLLIVGLACTALQPFIAYNLGNANINKCYVTAIIKETAVLLNTTNTTTARKVATEDDIVDFTEKDQIVLFVTMFAINLFNSFFDGGLDAFIDLGVMQRIKHSNTQEGAINHNFGWQRVWGSGGVFLGPLLGNLINDNFPQANITCYTGTYVIYALMNICYVLSLDCIFNGLKFKNEKENDNEILEDTDKIGEENLTKVLFKLIFRSDAIFFIITLLVLGIMLVQFLIFAFPYMKDLKTTASAMNVAMIIASASGVIGFVLSNRIIKFIGGYWQALALSLASFFCRYIIMAFTIDPFVIAAAQAFQLFASSMSESASVEFVDKTFPTTVLGSMYGLMNAIQFALSDIIGSSIGGVIYDNYGGAVLYTTFAIISAVFCILVMMYLFVINKHVNSSSSSTIKQNSNEV